MNTDDLRALTEGFAARLAGLTDDDRRRPTPCAGWTVEDLLRHVLHENAAFRDGFSGTSETVADDGDWEIRYRKVARDMEEAFAAGDPSELREVPGAGERPIGVLYEMQLADTLIHTWDLAQALGLPYEPGEAVTGRVLRLMRKVPDAARGEGKPFAVVTDDGIDGLAPFDQVIRLSGRSSRTPR